MLRQSTMESMSKRKLGPWPETVNWERWLDDKKPTNRGNGGDKKERMLQRAPTPCFQGVWFMINFNGNFMDGNGFL